MTDEAAGDDDFEKLLAEAEKEDRESAQEAEQRYHELLHRSDEPNDDPDEPIQPGAPLIGILQYATKISPFRYRKFAMLARDLGASVRYTYFGDGIDGIKRGYERAANLLRNADALIIASGFPLDDDPSFKPLLHSRIAEGVRVVFAGVPGTEDERIRQQDLLDRYYIERLPLKIVEGVSNRYWVRFRRDQDSLSGHELFVGVHELLVSSPAVVRYSYEACPLIYGADDHWTVDRRTDYRDPLLGRRVTCMAIWYGSKRGAVVVDHSAGTIADPIDVLAGHMPGIDANTAFAKNLIGFLLAAPTTQVRVSNRDRLYRVECNLCDFTIGVLSRSAADWETLVPPKILAKLHDRARDASAVPRFGESTPSIAFSEVWYFGEIIKANWELFKGEFEAMGLTKSDVQKRIESLNELRRLPGHPVLEYVTHYELTEAEQRLVEDLDSTFQALAKPFVGLSRAPK